jgi:hypothetical protein
LRPFGWWTLRGLLKKRLEKEWVSQEELSGGLCRALERKPLKPLVKEDLCVFLRLLQKVAKNSKKENSRFSVES